jgi:hypothetical protein
MNSTAKKSMNSTVRGIMSSAVSHNYITNVEQVI